MNVVGHIRPVLSEMITSVTLATMILHILPFSILMTLSGMARDVVTPAPVASSITLRGSVRPFPSPPLMTWRSESVGEANDEDVPLQVLELYVQ